jgi:hypothetical protein
LKRLALLIGAALTLAACDGPPASQGAAAPAAAAFSHDLSLDASGYYLALDPVVVGDWRLHHLFVGQAQEFDAWEGGRRDAAFGPVMIEFEDQASPMIANELGEARAGRSRVLPTTYRVDDRTVRFEGVSRALGPVSFEGRLNADRLEAARRSLGDDGVVLAGTLKVGERTFDGVRFRWWAGD